MDHKGSWEEGGVPNPRCVLISKVTKNMSTKFDANILNDIDLINNGDGRVGRGGADGHCLQVSKILQAKLS